MPSHQIASQSSPREDESAAAFAGMGSQFGSSDTGQSQPTDYELGTPRHRSHTYGNNQHRNSFSNGRDSSNSANAYSQSDFGAQGSNGEPRQSRSNPQHSSSRAADAARSGQAGSRAESRSQRSTGDSLAEHYRIRDDRRDSADRRQTRQGTPSSTAATDGSR